MIYELCVVQSGDATDESVAKLTETLRSVLAEYNGELMIQDNWGVKTLHNRLVQEKRNRKLFLFHL